MKRAGTIIRRAIVPMSIPPTVPTPMDMFPFAPTPLANIRGSIPKIIVSEVMRIGLRRAFAADIAAITDADGANAFIAKIDDYTHIWDSKAKARRLFAEHMAKVENVTYDKKTKRYAAAN